MAALRKALPAGLTGVTLLDADAARILIEGFVPPSALVTSSVLDHIDTHMRHFIETSPLCFISSANTDRVQEISPRGDPQGSFKVLNVSWPRFLWTPHCPLEPRRNGPHEGQFS
jgi:predicted pyridoxine 5'-phosphate oxidase superfamily flavin-nucleotide-binding protein